MNGILSYIKNAYQELAFKVTWPTFAELQNSAVVVLAASVIIAMIVLVMDKSAEGASTFIYNILMGS